MLISEIFYSIQGEGELTGVPSVFVRTAGCNLRCTWCDTKYSSWSPEGDEMGLEEIVERVARFPAKHCVLTGGEPMIARGLGELAARLRGLGKHITIETAGTIAPNGIECDLASISPKLASSTPAAGEISPEWIERHETARVRPEILREWVARYPYQLKFVVSALGEVEEIEALVAEIAVPIPAFKILLMPEGTDSAALRARSAMLAEACKTRGYRYCARLHIDLFGNTKGT
ncbi:MAG: 7-carboxy-7-deazaguanine synthase [Chthoniobacter sp.]|jgi:7-carboxy-7-deazaguanine synthase|nr:7-carboxy-7-deazaguanine synthase [Chthoniobacter sp.]